MDTPLADLVETLLSGGSPPDVIVLAVRAAELAIHSLSRASDVVDTAATKRRAWDRERKKAKREAEKAMSTGCPPDSTGQTSLIELSSSEETIKLEEEESKKEALSGGNRVEVHRTRRRKGALPADWAPPQRAYNLAVTLGLHVEDIEPQFRDYLASSGKQYLDYDAGFCNFIRNAQKFGNGVRNGRQIQGNLAPAFDDLIDRVRSLDNAPGIRGAEGKADVRLLPKG